MLFNPPFCFPSVKVHSVYVMKQTQTACIAVKHLTLPHPLLTPYTSMTKGVERKSFTLKCLHWKLILFWNWCFYILNWYFKVWLIETFRSWPGLLVPWARSIQHSTANPCHRLPFSRHLHSLRRPLTRFLPSFGILQLSAPPLASAQHRTSRHRVIPTQHSAGKIPQV